MEPLIKDVFDNSERTMLVDPKYRNILGIIQLTKPNDGFVTPINLESVSPLSDAPVLQYDFDLYAEMFANNPYFNQGLQSPMSYVFTEDNQFKVKPRILTYLLDNEDPTSLKIETKYTCCVEYFDPDNVNFLKHFKFIKFKDRYGFLNIRKELYLDENNKAYVKFKSKFPGICKFRSKDSSYICSMSILQCRFIQEVIDDEF